MLNLAGKSVNKYGKDQTGKIIYRFDQYGFREGNDYNLDPTYVFFGASALAGIGVQQEHRFTNYIQPSWNFGLCGKYIEEESIQNYFSFVSKYQSENNFKIIFCWKSLEIEKLEELINKVPDKENIFHCVPLKISRERTCRYFHNIDYDVSGTHWGPVTHKKFAKLLWQLLK